MSKNKIKIKLVIFIKVINSAFKCLINFQKKPNHFLGLCSTLNFLGLHSTLNFLGLRSTLNFLGLRSTLNFLGLRSTLNF